MTSVWRDRRLVYVMSTNSNPTDSSTIHRKNRDGTTEVASCPPNIVSYNKFMGGVDRADQLRQYYHVRSKSRKFYLYIFWFILQLSTLSYYGRTFLHSQISVFGNNHLNSSASLLPMPLWEGTTLVIATVYQHPSVRLATHLEPRDRDLVAVIHRLWVVFPSRVPVAGARFAGTSEKSATKHAFDVGNVGRRFVLNPGI